MPRVRVYLDENVPASLYGYLRQRHVAVTTAQHEQTRGFPDDDQLRYASYRGFVLLTTNMRHFHLWHRAFRANGWEHGGIITVPQDDRLPRRLHIRSAMLTAWADTFATTRNALFRWTDLQTRLYGGYALSGFSADEIDLAVGRTSPTSEP
jgi:Domain of unknown function (DUF5615)